MIFLTNLISFPVFFQYTDWPVFSGYNVQQTTANSKQTPALTQTSVPSSADGREGESKPAASKILLK